MLPNTTANISDGTDNHVYDLRSVGDNKSIRVETAADLDKPATLTISHEMIGDGIKSRRRSVVRLDDVVEDSEGNQGVISVYQVVDAPVKVTDIATVTKTHTKLASFFATSTYKTQFLAGEI